MLKVNFYAINRRIPLINRACQCPNQIWIARLTVNLCGSRIINNDARICSVIRYDVIADFTVVCIRHIRSRFRIFPKGSTDHVWYIE